MKDEINILFFKNVGNNLDGEDFKYIVKKGDNDEYTIEEVPIVLKDHLSSLNEYLCYDYDELSIYNQQRYEKFRINLKRVNNNIYSVQTKTYQIRKNLFT